MLGLLGLALASAPLALAAATATAQCPDGYGFSFPNKTDPADQNLTFDLGQKLNIQWRSPWPSVKLGFIGEDSSTFIFIDGLDGGEARSNYGWNVNVNNSKNDNDQYYLYFEDATNNDNHCYSSLWSIKDDKAVTSGPSSTSKPIVTRTPTPTDAINIQTTTNANGPTTVLVTTGLSSPTGAAAQNSPQATSTIIAQEGLSAGAKAGIGVGVTLGVIAIIGGIVAGIFFMRRRKRAAAEEMGPSINTGYGGGPPAISKPVMTTTDQHGGAAGFYAPKPPMPVATAPQELDSAAVASAPPNGMMRQGTLHEMSA